MKMGMSFISEVKNNKGVLITTSASEFRVSLCFCNNLACLKMCIILTVAVPDWGGF